MTDQSRKYWHRSNEHLLSVIKAGPERLENIVINTEKPFSDVRASGASGVSECHQNLTDRHDAPVGPGMQNDAGLGPSQS